MVSFCIVFDSGQLYVRFMLLFDARALSCSFLTRCFISTCIYESFYLVIRLDDIQSHVNILYKHSDQIKNQFLLLGVVCLLTIRNTIVKKELETIKNWSTARIPRDLSNIKRDFY